jgi:hypothetical protein
MEAIATETKTAAEIAEDLKVGMDNRIIDQDFAREREKLEKQINALREELKPVRRRAQLGDNTVETFREHEEIVHEMLELEVEKLLRQHNGDDVIEEVARQFGAKNIQEYKEEILAEFKAAFEEGLSS